MGRKAILLAGLAYGDEGKGSVADYLVRRELATAVVRYNGGAQAAHRVVLPCGKAHVFAQFGSGTLVPKVRTHLSRFMLVEPLGLMREEEHLRNLGITDAFDRLTIDAEAPVITPFHIATNRLLEASRGANRHGSCGLGIGETVEDIKELGDLVLRVKDLSKLSQTQEKLEETRKRKLAKIEDLIPKISPSMHLHLQLLQNYQAASGYAERYRHFATKIQIVPGSYLEHLTQTGVLVFEGAQGLLLDPSFGTPPHVTKTDITFNNAFTLLSEVGYSHPVRKVGVVRAYHTRHGNGPFPTFDAELSTILADAANKDHDWQGKFKVGYFDADQTAYAIKSLGGIDELAITCLDRLSETPKPWKIWLANTYCHFGTVYSDREACEYASGIAEMLGHNGKMIWSFDPTANGKITLRHKKAKANVS